MRRKARQEVQALPGWREHCAGAKWPLVTAVAGDVFSPPSGVETGPAGAVLAFAAAEQAQLVLDAHFCVCFTSRAVHTLVTKTGCSK